MRGRRRIGYCNTIFKPISKILSYLYATNGATKSEKHLVPEPFCVVMASLSLLMSRRPRCHRDDVVALIVMMLLPLMRRHLCHHGNGDCCHHPDGISAIVKLAWSSSWCCCPCDNGVVAVIDNNRHCYPHWNGMFAPLHWCHRPCHTGVIILSMLALMHLSCRPLCLFVPALCSYFAGIFALIKLACTKPRTMR